MDPGYPLTIIDVRRRSTARVHDYLLGRATVASVDVDPVTVAHGQAILARDDRAAAGPGLVPPLWRPAPGGGLDSPDRTAIDAGPGRVAAGPTHLPSGTIRV